MRKILIFTRPWLTDFYRNILDRSVIKNFKKIYITEFITEAEKYNDFLYISYMKKSTNNYSYCFFNDAEIYDIIKRDRYLVQCNFSKALEYINTITEQLLEIYEKFEPDIVFGHLVDTYIHDIFYRIAIKKNIFQFSFVWDGVVNNTFKIYNYTKPILNIRKNQNVDLFKTMSSKREDISNPIVRNFDLYKRLRGKASVIKSKIKAFDPLYRDRHNYYFEALISGTVASPVLNLRDLLPGYYSDLNKISFNKNKRIYVSLHYVPEATINNLTENNSLIDHDKIIIDIVSKYNQEYTFIIKEHPAMYGKRNLSFYDKLKRIENVYLIHPKFKYYEVFEHVDYVLSWGGTVGVEAPFFNVKTLNICKPYYYIKGYENHFNDYQDLINNFSQKIDSLTYDDKSYCEALNELFKSILFDGIASEMYNYEDNIKKISEATNTLINDIYQLNL